ncbi:MAG: class I SAM-dependent methyltransferase [Nitrospirae bacterium]|nr:class I SAM-dependent methyltransferase [Nitrospirota bacterium]
MKETKLKVNSTVQFWDKNAKWYKLWIEHNSYHSEIIKILTSLVKPAWKVLDIGAGNGILSLPLCAIGCNVTALEPSEGMRNLLYEGVKRAGINNISIESRRWEEMPISEIFDHDLVIASNSLHLTELGFLYGLEKIFMAEPENIFIVTEIHFSDLAIRERLYDYEIIYKKFIETESSYAYHCLEEAIEHWTFKNGRIPVYNERTELMLQLTYERGHLWKKGYTTVGIFWWAKNKAIFNINSNKGGIPCFSGY